MQYAGNIRIWIAFCFKFSTRGVLTGNTAFNDSHTMVLPESKQLPLEVQQYIRDLQRYIHNYKARLEPLLKMQEEDDDKFEEQCRQNDDFIE